MIEVRYKCSCMSEEASVRLPYRESVEDIRDWVRGKMSEAISADHAERSPACGSTIMEYVKIPAPENAPYIGGKPELDS